MSMNTAKQIRVAKRYARALFEVSEPAEFDRVAAQLKALATAWRESVDFRELMQNPAVQEAVRVDVVSALIRVLSPADGQQGAYWATVATQRTVEAIVALRKAAIFPPLFDAFILLVNEFRRSLTLNVSVATPRSAEEISKLRVDLSSSLGGEVTLNVKHDPSLLGGITIRLGDRLLDRSVAGTLQRIAGQIGVN
jgi:F-type H+-transporting ATPase subunit delta